MEIGYYRCLPPCPDWSYSPVADVAEEDEEDDDDPDVA